MDEDGHLKIADFGVAMDDIWPGEKIEERGKTGTPSYMAPEVCLLNGMIGAKIRAVPHTRVSQYANRARTHEHTNTRVRNPTRKIRLHAETRLTRGDFARDCLLGPLEK